MVEITKENFSSLMSDLFDAVRDADFIAIDTNAEASGFLMLDETINHRLIRDGWYKTVYDEQTTKSSLDFGIAVFKKEQSSDQSAGDTSSCDRMNRYKVRCYSVPMLVAYVEEHDARSEIRHMRDKEERLHLDNFAFEFIQRTNLDLNKVLYGGTPFINKERSEDAVKYMTKYPDFMFVEGKHQTNGVLDEAYFPKLIKQVDENDIKEILERLRGIGKFFDMTAETKVPIVGHNLLIKLILLYKDFVEYLPQEFSEFLLKLEKVMPHYYDTKYMAWEIVHRSGINDHKKGMLKNHSLFELYRNLGWVGKYVFEFNLDKETKEVYSEDLEDLLTNQLEWEADGFCHESGFDACVTGIVFARLAYLGMKELSNASSDKHFALDNEFYHNGSMLWKNKIFMQDELSSSHNQEKNDL